MQFYQSGEGTNPITAFLQETEPTGAEKPAAPPVIWPGWNSQVQRLTRQERRSHRESRDLMFRSEDRRRFQAIHPFVLPDAAPLPIEQSLRRKAK
ncbi:MAG: hypothetical protein M3347_16485 [Armatimonadota bacterium]|nr:hypothetical protein [Armatimonadota bacterium]